MKSKNNILPSLAIHPDPLEVVPEHTEGRCVITGQMHFLRWILNSSEYCQKVERNMKLAELLSSHVDHLATEYISLKFK